MSVLGQANFLEFCIPFENFDTWWGVLLELLYEDERNTNFASKILREHGC